MADPYEDQCTTFSTCHSCLANSSCGWCSDTLTSIAWGECRSIYAKKNGEYGEQFCNREDAFWHVNDCEPTLAEISAVLSSYDLSVYQEGFLTIASNVCEECLTAQQRISFLDISQNNTFNTKITYFFDIKAYNMVIPLNIFNAQCPMMISLTQQMAPVKDRFIDCFGTVILTDKMISEITISGEVPSPSSSASPTCYYYFQIFLLLLMYWVVLANI